MADEPQESRDPAAADNRPSLWRRVFGVALRLLVVALIGAGLGIGAYFGLPAIYRDFIAPVQQNTQQLDRTQADLASLRASQRAAIATQLAQMAEIQGQIGQQAEELSALQADVGSLQASQPTLVAGLRSVDRLSAELADLQAEATQTAGRLDGLDAAASTPNPTVQAVSRRLAVLRLMQLVSQARISVAEGNLGQAGGDVQSASAALSDLMAGSDEVQQAAFEDVSKRLDLAQQELKANPPVAADDLDIAWQLLVELSRGP